MFCSSVTACIRRQEGYCCVQYQVCSNVINPYTLSGQAAIAILYSNCIKDYVSIGGNGTFELDYCKPRNLSASNNSDNSGTFGLISLIINQFN